MDAWAEEFPGLSHWVGQVQSSLPVEVDLWQLIGDPMVPGSVGERSLVSTQPSGGESVRKECVSEIEGIGRATVTRIEPREDFGPGEEMPQHAFEKVETLEEYAGQSAHPDADDQLAEHGEALNDLRMTQVIRTADRPRSIYRSDVILDGLNLELNRADRPAGVAYPEWDHRMRKYRPNWCFVQSCGTQKTALGWSRRTHQKYQGVIRRLQREFATLVAERRRLRRQPLGSEFDLDALIASEVERRVGHTPDELVYLDTRHERHDVSALILIDRSYSTDAWLGNRRILDLITEIVFCVGEVLDDHLERLAVAAFASNTRYECRFDVVKGFDDPWAGTGDRLGALEPSGYTRMGPALRHSQELLQREFSKKKLIILITDGRPCDYDQYEGNHGIHDVKKAIETGTRNDIRTHAFAVERKAAEYFPRMFTPRNYDIVSTPEHLTRKLCRLFARQLADV
jgi:nitric oxide reductase NorD protein